MQQHIAIVEDEAAIAANYRDHLQRQGFRVSLFADRNSAADAFAIQLPDLAIIDVGLGKEMEGGFELCRDLRAPRSRYTDCVSDRERYRVGHYFRLPIGSR